MRKVDGLTRFIYYFTQNDEGGEENWKELERIGKLKGKKKRRKRGRERERERVRREK